MVGQDGLMVETGRRSGRARRRLPIVTLVCLGATLGALVALGFLAQSVPAGLLLGAPPALGLLGSVAALLDRRLDREDRRDWAIGSALSGFVGVVALYVVVTLVEAVDWTVNGPPAWL
jgi:4-hydroxybenzoate polyprenyltransferase